MSGRITSDGANYVLNLLVNADQPVANYYVALINGNAPSYSAKGDELEEPTNAEYARAQVASTSGNWNVQSGVLTNYQPIYFPVASTDWGTQRYWAITDAAVGGRAFWVGTLNSPIGTTIGQQFYFPAGSLGLSIPNSVWKVYL